MSLLIAIVDDIALGHVFKHEIITHTISKIFVNNEVFVGVRKMRIKMLPRIRTWFQAHLAVGGVELERAS